MSLHIHRPRSVPGVCNETLLKVLVQVDGVCKHCLWFYSEGFGPLSLKVSLKFSFYSGVVW